MIKTSYSARALVRLGVPALAIAAAVVYLWPAVSPQLLSTDYMPHGHCYLWEPGLVGLHFVSDLLIGIAYVAISLTLAYLVRKAPGGIPFHWVFLAFGIFII